MRGSHWRMPTTEPRHCRYVAVSARRQPQVKCLSALLISGGDFTVAPVYIAVTPQCECCDVFNRVGASVITVTDKLSEAPSTPATMSKQHSTLLPRTATMSNDSIVKFRPFDKVETNWTCSICFDIVERTKFRPTLLPKPATLLPKRQKCLSNVRLCRKNRSTCSVRQCCFDIVASMDGARGLRRGVGFLPKRGPPVFTILQNIIK